MHALDSQLSQALGYMKQKKLQNFKKLVHAQDGILHGEKENLHLKEISCTTTNQKLRYSCSSYNEAASLYVYSALYM